MKTIGVYISFPFCIARCAFCAFSVQGYRSGWAKRYLSALENEIRCCARETVGTGTLASIYLGGGTPTLYLPQEILGLLSLIREECTVASDMEITLEAHPATLTQENLTAYRQGGINRLSIGVQSFLDKDLLLLGRNHTAADACSAYASARAAGFDNISIDLIYGLPGQTVAAWEENLATVLSLAPEHISIYSLSIEEGTLFHKTVDHLLLPSEEEEILQYEHAQRRFVLSGYRQYEISNFARPHFACRHNLLYWDRGEVLGLGLAAHSYINRQHRSNTDLLSLYISRVEEGVLPVEQMEEVDPAEERRDRIIFGLRKTEGIPEDLLKSDARLVKEADLLVLEGLLIRHEGVLRLTSRGMLMADEVALVLL